MPTSFPFLRIARDYQIPYIDVLKQAAEFEQFTSADLEDLVMYDMRLPPTQRMILWAVLEERKRRELVSR